MFAEPTPMDHGKAAHNFLVVYCNFYPPLRFKSRGRIMQVFCFDRALYSAMMDLLEAKRLLLYSEHGPPLPTADGQLARPTPQERAKLRSKDLLIGVPCPSHGMSNGTKWGASRYCNDGVLDALHKRLEPSQTGTFFCRTQKQ